MTTKTSLRVSLPHTARLRLAQRSAHFCALALVAAASALAGTALAGGKPPAPAPSAAPAPPPSEFQWTAGPTKVNLGHELDLTLPEEYLFLGMPQADKLLQKLGSFHNTNLVGVIAPKDETQNYFVVIDYDGVGYVKDDEKIDADDLIKSFREGQEQANKQRVEKGFTALTIEKWAEPPHYDKALHHVIWGLTVGDKEGKSINYNTRILGRRGYVALNLVTGPERFAQDKPIASKLLAATTFRQGARYEDFDKSKGDKVAEYGLVGLVLGGLGVAKLVKIGLAKFWKLILVGIAGAFAAIKKFFTGNKGAPPAPPAA